MIEFLKTVACEGKYFEAGAVVPPSAVPGDHLACCLRLGYARELPAPEPEQPPAPAPAKKK